MRLLWGRRRNSSATKGGSRFGRRRKALLLFIVAALLIVPDDTLHLTPARLVASSHLFSTKQWEVTNLPRKWLHLTWETITFRKPSREERLVIVEDYLVAARKAQKEKDRVEGLQFRRGSTVASGSATKQKPPDSKFLNKLLNAKENLQARAEEAIEAELSAVLKDEGLGSRFGVLFPPVDMRFGELPTYLVVSPRDRIQLVDAVLLHPDITPFERDRIETELLERYNLSAFVDDLAGLATYPSHVSDLFQLRFILRTAAHEWLHHYWGQRSFGENLRLTLDMYTLNETAADVAGRELGDAVFVRMGGDLSESSRRYLSEEEQDPRFTKEMRETRLGVEELLAQGKVEEAEEYMKERWWYLSLGGYRLRKLNQAYFAFRGNYAESPASVSPIGDQLKECGAFFPA